MKKPDAESKNYALRHALAGRHSDDRKITINYQNRQQIFYPDQPVNLLKANKGDDRLIRPEIIDDNIGYVLINNVLGNNDLIPLFDSALNKLASARGLASEQITKQEKRFWQTPGETCVTTFCL